MRYIVSLILVAFAASMQAQQTTQYTLFMMNPLQWNPAYAGLDQSLSITAGYRKQWTQLPGSPASQYVSAHLPLYLLGGGVGIQVENDRLGAGRWSSANLSYSYQMPLENGVFAIGLGGGIVQRTLDGNQIRTPDGNYEPGSVINHNDPLLPIGLESGMAPTFHVGVFYQAERLEAGIGVRHLAENGIDLPTLRFQLDRNVYFQLGAHFDIGRNLSFHPALLVRTDMVQTQTDLAAIFRIQENIFAGASFRGYSAETGDAMSLIGGFKLSENITLAYAYDIAISNLRRVNNGSHEIVLQYNLNKPIGVGRLPRIIYNPRTL